MLQICQSVSARRKGLKSFCDRPLSVACRLSTISYEHDQAFIYCPMFTKLIQYLDIHKSLVPFENQPDPFMHYGIMAL